jgi:RNA methyltransferase, TrmH family
VITLRKIRTLKPTVRLRKCAHVFREAGRLFSAGSPADRVYLDGLLEIILETGLPESSVDKFDIRYISEKQIKLNNVPDSEMVWLCDDIYYFLMNSLGVTVADWDFHDETGEVLSTEKRLIYPIRPYLDHIRSPFNVGAIFRAAESFCCDRVIISADTASPDHPRASRTSRGCTDTLPWETAEISSLMDQNLGLGPVFSLETGGVDIDEFIFPDNGTVLVGSEELGVSPEGLLIADSSLGRVSIPTYGAKGSLNVSVAYGILMQRWVEELVRRNHV